MTRFLDSLYARLVLVLIVALTAGFGTMYALFKAHSNDNRIRNIAHSVSVQIQLVEELLRSHPEFEAKPTYGITISPSPPTAGTVKPNEEEAEFLDHLKEAVNDELGRNVEIRASTPEGYWMPLSGLPQGERWLHFPMPRHRSRIETWAWGLWASFVVVLVGGMALLWGVNKPLRRLERAIAQVGRADSPVAEASGPREIRHLAEQFNQMVSRLEQYDRDRAEMLTGVAHDLRAPITRLRLQLELEDGARREAMIANLQGIASIVDQFLSFAQGVPTEPRARRELGTLIRGTAAPYLAAEVAIKPPGEAGLEAEVMPLLLQRAVANLLDNACEYGKPPVTVTWERQAGEAVIRVTDCGPGIPAERMDSAMQAFTRLDSARSGKGHCGLGLAIVAKIAKLHGGRLVLAPGKQGGLAAEIRLPLPPNPISAAHTAENICS